MSDQASMSRLFVLIGKQAQKQLINNNNPHKNTTSEAYCDQTKASLQLSR